jgi:major cell surface glycoprotein (TIGR04216 family)
MVFSVFAMAAPAGALDGVREDTDENDPAIVYWEEEGLNLTVPDAGNTTGSNPWGGAETFEGVAGDADGDSVTVTNVSSVDIDAAEGFTTGGYSTNSSDDVELSVKRAQVTDLDVELQSNDADVAGGTVPQGNNVTVSPEFNFDDASYVEIDVYDDSGTNIIQTVNSTWGTTPVGVALDSGDEVILNMSDMETGQYRVVARGADDDSDDNRDLISTAPDDEGTSELDYASMETTFTIGTTDTDISLNKDAVIQGQTVTATVSGEPGEFRVVQISEDDGRNWGGGASNVSSRLLFRDTSDVRNRTNNGSTYNAAILDLGDSGSAQVQIRSQYLDDSSVDVEVVVPSDHEKLADRASHIPDGAPLSDDNESSAQAAVGQGDEDDAAVDVSEPKVEITNAPSVIAIGEEFDIEGNAEEITDVRAYAKVDNTWEALTDANETVDADDSFVIDDIESSTVINIPGTYRVSVVDVDELDDVGAGTDAQEITEDTFTDLDRDAAFSLRTQKGALNAQLNSNTVAFDVGDEVELSGTAVGQGDSLRVYVIDPRGNLENQGGTGIGETVSIDDDNNFSEESGALFDTRGNHVVVVVGAGRDSDYADADWDFGGGTQLTSGTATQEQKLEVLRDTYEDAGEDDVMVELSVKAEEPRLTFDELGQNGQVEQGEVTISGASNREDETNIFIEVLDSDGNSVATGEAEVDGPTSSWSTTIDMSGVATGEYEITADDGEVTADTTVQLVESVTPTPEPETDTPTPEPETDTPTPEPETDTPTDTETMTETETATATETTDAQGPGFGVIVAVIALLAAALLAVRRRD